MLGGDVPAPLTSGNTLAHNLFFTEGGTSAVHWKWEMDESTDPVQGWSGLQALDNTGLFGDPLFANATNSQTNGTEDFRLFNVNSPAVDSGLTTLPKLGRRDVAKSLRQRGAAIDRGAHELQ